MAVVEIYGETSSQDFVDLLTDSLDTNNDSLISMEEFKTGFRTIASPLASALVSSMRRAFRGRMQQDLVAELLEAVAVLADEVSCNSLLDIGLPDFPLPLGADTIK